MEVTGAETGMSSYTGNRGESRYSVTQRKIFVVGLRWYGEAEFSAVQCDDIRQRSRADRRDYCGVAPVLVSYRLRWQGRIRGKRSPL